MAVCSFPLDSACFHRLRNKDIDLLHAIRVRALLHFLAVIFAMMVHVDDDRRDFALLDSPRKRRIRPFQFILTGAVGPSGKGIEFDPSAIIFSPPPAYRSIERCAMPPRGKGCNPAEEVKLPKEPKRRLRFLESEEEQKLIDAATSPLKELIVIGIKCGLRIEAEALPMRWGDVDFRRRFLTVQAAYAQNGTTRSIPLNQRAVDALIELKQRGKGASCSVSRTAAL